jgi:hypothetical protein
MADAYSDYLGWSTFQPADGDDLVLAIGIHDQYADEKNHSQHFCIFL